MKIIDAPHQDRPRDEDFATFAVLTLAGVAFAIGCGLYELVMRAGG